MVVDLDRARRHIAQHLILRYAHIDVGYLHHLPFHFHPQRKKVRSEAYASFCRWDWCVRFWSGRCPFHAVETMLHELLHYVGWELHWGEYPYGGEVRCLWHGTAFRSALVAHSCELFGIPRGWLVGAERQRRLYRTDDFIVQAMRKVGHDSIAFAAAANGESPESLALGSGCKTGRYVPARGMGVSHPAMQAAARGRSSRARPR